MTGRQFQVLPTGLPLNPLMCSNGRLVNRVRASNVSLAETVSQRIVTGIHLLRTIGEFVPVTGQPEEIRKATSRNVERAAGRSV